jgi:cytochrome c-type biogenesis protein CcmH
MNTFLLISGAMVAIAILLLAPTLLRQRHEAREDTREYNIRIARERLAELEKENAKGELSEEEFSQAKQDLEIALAQDLSTASSKTGHSDDKGTARMTLVIIAVLLPAMVYGIYQKIGSPEHLHVVGPGQPAPAHAGDGQMPSIEAMVAELDRRLQAEPNNPEGWFLLGRTYMKLERYGDAVRAYERLNEVMPGQPAAMISLVDALAMQADGQVTERGVELLEQILEIDPQAATALWLLGNAAAQQGDDSKALENWSRAVPLLADDPGMQQQLLAQIGEIEARTGLQADIPAPPPPIMPAPQPSQSPQAPVPPALAGEGLQVEVALDAEMLDRVAATDTVFVYAKAVSGPPMPLAVARHRVADLPLQVVLNDSMAMMPQMKLSSFDRVLVGARISKTGQAMPQPGDLQSDEVATASDSQDNIQLLINQQRP